jgi:uncharacterized protein GlcG (DUF336 family)
MRRFDFRRHCPRHAKSRAAGPSIEALEARELLSARAGGALPVLKSQDASVVPAPHTDTSASADTLGFNGYDPSNVSELITPSEVKILLERAAAASSTQDAIIAVVDRSGNILGVRIENGVSPLITGNLTNKVFAIDGAVSLARTGAFFANNQAPLTSRTIQDISQSTITQREVDSTPDVPDPNGDSTLYGPGFVAPVGLKGHFPPGVMFTPQVDLFGIEDTNRDSLVNGTRFNVPQQYIPSGAQTFMTTAPESYGQITGLLPTAQSRGIATLPGGLPLYRNGVLVGGIGVFFPGTTGYATEENSKLNTPALYNPKKTDLSEEGEYMAFVAAGGSEMAGVPFGAENGAPALPGFTEPFGRIDLVGITLDIFGGHGLQGIKNLLSFGSTLGAGNPNDGTDQEVDSEGDLYLGGQAVPYGWLVTPHDATDGSGLTAADVEAIVARGIAEANQARSAIRLPLNSTAKMVFAVSDKSGNILGLYRMPDATVFSVGVAVAKARNVAYYDNASELQPIDQVKSVPAGTSFTNRTFRYLALPYFPEGININPPGPFSILNDGGVNRNGTTKGAPLPASAFQSVQGHDAFNPNTNFRDPYNTDNQNGIVFFPGSSALYKQLNGSSIRELVGGLGVSGDGVDQDDVVTSEASLNYNPPYTIPRADMVKVRGVRLPYIKFNRQPHVPLNGPKLPIIKIKPPLPPPRKKRS